MKSALIVSTLSILAFVNCSQIRLAPLGPSSLTASSKGEFCVSEPQELKRFTKFLFVVDKSGSNVSGASPSDPGAVRRAGSIEKFFNDNRDNDWMRWGMIVFQSTPPTQSYLGGPQEPIFVGDDPSELPQFDDAINRLRTDPDAGGTPYADALNLARIAVENDIQLHDDQDNTYMIFFLSDGFPQPEIADQALRNTVRSIVDLRPGRVFLSSGFYSGGANIPEAIARLQLMAEEGRGKFVNFLATPDFDFNELIVSGPSKEPWAIKELLVYNLNSAICEDGAYDTDSDADGLCDRDERARDGFRDQQGRVWRFNPTQRWSNSGPLSGYGDYFAWRALRYGEVLPPCNDTNYKKDDDFDQLTACEERYLFNSNPTGTDLRSGDTLNPDTDGDGILDGIETFVFRNSLGAALDMFNLLRSPPDFESDSAGKQIKDHRNPLSYDPSAPRYDTQLIPLGINDSGQNCYSFSQNNLRLHATRAVASDSTLAGLSHSEDENVILLYYIQTPQRDPSAKGVLRYSFQKLLNNSGFHTAHGTGAGLRLDRFQSYIIPRDP